MIFFSPFLAAALSRTLYRRLVMSHMVVRANSSRKHLAKWPMQVIEQMRNDRAVEQFRRSLPGPDWDHFRYASLGSEAPKWRKRFRAHGASRYESCSLAFDARCVRLFGVALY